jgi:hypothetical protein
VHAPNDRSVNLKAKLAAGRPILGLSILFHG